MASSSPADIGFQRPEMFSEPLPGTVGPYEMHVLAAVAEEATAWPKWVTPATHNEKCLEIADLLKKKKETKDLTKEVKFTVVQACSPIQAGDVILLPHMLHYSHVSDPVSFVDQLVSQTAPPSSPAPQPLPSPHVILVCCHGHHDARCGACGPDLLTAFRQRLAGQHSSVLPCSHIGGHKFAGNVIVYSRPPGTTTVQGHWYGYVTPNDVDTLLDALKEGKVVHRLWRGAIGLTKDQQKEYHLEAAKAAGNSAGQPGTGCGANCFCSPNYVAAKAEAKEERKKGDDAAPTLYAKCLTSALAVAVSAVCIGVAYYLRYV